jgi:hypothetical protein
MAILASAARTEEIPNRPGPRIGAKVDRGPLMAVRDVYLRIEEIVGYSPVEPSSHSRGTCAGRGRRLHRAHARGRAARPGDVARDGAGPCADSALAFVRGANYLFALATAAVIVVIAIVAALAERKDQWFDDLPHWLERLLPVVPIVTFAALAMLLGVVRKRPSKPRTR